MKDKVLIMEHKDEFGKTFWQMEWEREFRQAYNARLTAGIFIIISLLELLYILTH